MPTTQFPKIPGPPNKPDLQALSAYVGQLANLLAVLSKELDYLLNGSLDVNNIRAHSITADTLNVDELSAITANLGTITAGIINGIEIYGSYIATANGTFPRVEMSTTQNLFRAYLTADTYLEIVPNFDGTSPVINLVSGGANRGLFRINGSNELEISGGTAVNLLGGDINLRPDPVLNKKVKVSDFNTIQNSGGTGLQDALNTKASGSGISGTVFVAATSGGPANVPITFSNGVRIS